MKMRIAVVNDLWFKLPTKKYGGAERVVYSFVENLVQKGHDVTLYSVGTTQTSAKLVSVYPRSMVDDGIARTNFTYPLLNILEALEHEKDYDIIHFHINVESDYPALPLSAHLKDKVLFTLHFVAPTSKGYKDRDKILRKNKNLNYISISKAQRKGMEYLNWVRTVYNGIDVKKLQFDNTPEDYFVWMGKFNPDKGTKLAIQAAKKAGVKLLLAGAIDKLDSKDFAYYTNEIKPLIDNKQIIYVGEVNDAQKNTLLGNALGFLNPILWNEPFGLVVAESLACGTPVISFNKGAAPEVISDKKTGYIVKDLDEMVEKIKHIESINRKDCRIRAESTFSVEAMTQGYLSVYEDVLNKTL